MWDKDWREAVRQHDHEEKSADGIEEAAVLFPIYEKTEDEPGIIFTERTNDLPRHPGEVSFPGGRVEEQDVSLLDTALREIHEEVGLPPGEVEVVGRLDDAQTTTGYRITPFVGEVPRDYPYVAQESEVDEIIFAPIEELADPSIHEKKVKKGYELHYFYYGDHIIWGATAGILVTFLEAMDEWPLGE